jgi:probable F420-dependent oxidoreductase
MQVDAMTGPLPLREMGEFARVAEAAGFSGVVLTEGGRTAYSAVAVGVLATERLHWATGIAVAFPRSPMITAQLAWELAEASGGRFRLGIGTQVRAHIERRYGMPFDPPGPRLRDYVETVRAVFAAFAGEAPLDHRGDFYELTLLNPQWSPDPLDVSPPPIDIAAVNPWMLRMAGEVADGVHVHPLGQAAYLADIVPAELAAGAARAGRDAADVARIVPCFTIVGDTDEERAWYRDFVRTQLAFYGSTPNYAFIFDEAGFDGTTARVRERQKAGDAAGMADQISDDIVAAFAVEAGWGDLATALTERYAGLADRLVLYLAGPAWRRNRDHFEAMGEVARRISAV